MESNGVGLEQRLSSLQAQIDRLRPPAGDDLAPLEQRLSTLTEYTATILRRWDATADRHAAAVSQLETQLRELGDAGSRLHSDAAQRLAELERIVEHEWSALRHLHEAPVRQLVEQAANLTEVCIATANAAQQGFDRAESRLATLEQDFHRTSADLAREVHALLGEVRLLSAGGQRQIPGEGAAWPLEGVTRLHQQLRDGADGPLTLSVAPDVSPAALRSSDASRPVGQPLDAVADPSQAAPVAAPVSRTAIATLPRSVIIAVAAVVIVGGLVFAWRLQNDVRLATARAEQSQRESRMATEAASKAAAERQEAAARQLVAARDLAARAQIIGDVLAAPDLVRYTLVSPGAARSANGQALWSRSRGFVFSASGLPVPPGGTTYQVWVLVRGGAVSAGTFVPDAGGRATLTATLDVPRPVFGAIVTTERSGGAETPMGELVLARTPAVTASTE